MAETVPSDPVRPAGLIGGIGMTEVHVYAQRLAPDGQFSGCPHVHAVTDEAYFILQGSGAVEFHDLKTGYRKVPLAKGDYLHFPPLVMHRLISDGDLVVLGIMANAGLAERGEARIYFGPDVDADSDRFADLLTLPQRLGLEGALQRRDTSVAAYQKLMADWYTDRDAYFRELERFVSLHCQAIAGKACEFQKAVETGPLAAGRETSRRIAELPQHDLAGSPAIWRNRVGDDQSFGMCGVLRPVLSLRAI